MAALSGFMTGLLIVGSPAWGWYISSKNWTWKKTIIIGGSVWLAYVVLWSYVWLNDGVF